MAMPTAMASWNMPAIQAKDSFNKGGKTRMIPSSMRMESSPNLPSRCVKFKVMPTPRGKAPPNWLAAKVSTNWRSAYRNRPLLSASSLKELSGSKIREPTLSLWTETSASAV
jgi:hypothetical protein